ncbi:hypothetical protein D9758_003958 [Tetrapyrgos nigripes]|uniref:Uncharacterized protein n=1 Tax=Tetrapyrgos nigripes TaxID=182062 RepID=A0A8H5GLF9_9AGAR|nr:hypothetical protein D9758_003958 [Tetrapyrgos nigripes]
MRPSFPTSYSTGLNGSQCGVIAFQITFAHSIMFRLTSARALSKAVKPASTRSFHSPFAVLGSASPSPSNVKPSTVYEKASEASEEFSQPAVGLRTHVISPNPTTMFKQVPTGAYPVSVSYAESSTTNQVSSN